MVLTYTCIYINILSLSKARYHANVLTSCAGATVLRVEWNTVAQNQGGQLGRNCKYYYLPENSLYIPIDA